MSGPKLSRRQFLTRTAGAGGGLVVLAGAGYAGYDWPHSSAAAATEPAKEVGVSHFVSRPDLSPPAVTLTRRPSSFDASADAPGYIFLSPKAYEAVGSGQQGLMILDTEGRLVWFLPLAGASSAPFDLQLQTYQDKPVLTWWSGTVIDGYGEGTGHIADTSYQKIATVKAAKGLHVDLHELNLTPSGTALITTYRTAKADLSALGGPTNGQVLACQAQEIDVASGKLVFSWDSLDHVPVTETYTALPPKGKPLDYFHMNSIALASDGDLLISGRNTWTAYKVSRSSGQIVWRLNGKESDFTMGTGSQFYWQHHVRAQTGNQISIFDDGAAPVEETQSRGILLSVDTTTKQAKLVSEYLHPAKLLAGNQGSIQCLSDGRVFIGWGDQPYFSEFTSDGEIVLDGRLPADDQSYRAFSYDWVGEPTDDPVVVVKSSTTGGVSVYVSWNGATEVDRWDVLAGSSPSSVSSVATAYRSGFETVISVHHTGPSFVVSALDSSGKQIGRSAPVKFA